MRDNLLATSELFAARFWLNQTSPEFPILLPSPVPNLRRQLAFPRGATPLADQVPASHSFPLFPALENAAVESVRVSSKKGTPAVRLDSRRSRRTHRRSRRLRVPRGCRQAALAAGRRALAHGQSSGVPIEENPCSWPGFFLPRIADRRSATVKRLFKTNYALQLAVGNELLQCCKVSIEPSLLIHRQKSPRFLCQSDQFPGFLDICRKWLVHYHVASRLEASLHKREMRVIGSRNRNKPNTWDLQ